MFADALLIGGAWIVAYSLRFHAGIPAPHGIPDVEVYAAALLAIVPVGILLLRSQGVYEPQRTGSLLREAGLVLRATAIGVSLLVVLNFFLRGYLFSRGVVLLFSVLAPLFVMGLRTGVRSALRAARRRGHNLRYVIVVGSGRLAEETIERIHAHPESGLRVRGVLTDELVTGRKVGGVEVIGRLGALKSKLLEARVDQVIVALPRNAGDGLEKVLRDLDDEMVSVQLVPDLVDFLTLRSSVESLDGLPIIALRESPIVGWAALQKRSFDVVLSFLGLLVAAPIVAALSLAIWLTSGRPLLHRQERMGLDGRTFTLIKLRSMTPDAEPADEAVWPTLDDPRVTKLGRWLRRTGFDELPQLWNVLRGEMSLVGPRPEREVFIEEFRSEIPGYMLRHKMRAGLTGWAQVHGWRGDTSLHERIEHDLYYIQNWSLGLDIRILLLTAWQTLTGRHR